MTHPDPRQIELLAAGGPPDAGAGDVRAHLLDCASCREALGAVRPTALFALLGGDRPAPVDWSAFSARLARAIREESSPPRLPAFGISWWKPAAILSAAAALVLLVLVPVVRTGDLVREAARSRAAERPPLAAGELPAGLLAALQGSEERLPVVEGVESPTAEIYELASLAGNGTDLVLVVDEDLDL